jgi:hypothetical protein
MKKIFALMVIISTIASPACARTLNYQSQAKAEKEAHNENMERARPSGQHEAASAARQQELMYENDANRLTTSPDRVQQIVDEQYQEAARAKELAGN